MIVNDVLNAFEIIKKINEQEFTIATTIKVAANVTLINEVLEVFNKKREAYLTSLGEDKLTPEQTAEAEEFINSLIREEIELELKLLSIEEVEGLKISSLEYSMVTWLFE